MNVGGSGTSTVTLTWALSLLIINKKAAMKKIQRGQGTQTGKRQACDWSDLKNLPYLQATIEETLRLYPTAPLSLPHEAMEDCNISVYSISKGTQLVLNLYKTQRDPRVWTDPSEFRPEWFQSTTNKDIDLRGHQ